MSSIKITDVGTPQSTGAVTTPTEPEVVDISEHIEAPSTGLAHDAGQGVLGVIELGYIPGATVRVPTPTEPEVTTVDPGTGPVAKVIDAPAKAEPHKATKATTKAVRK